MPVDLSELPRDANGAVPPMRIRHHSPDFSESLGNVHFASGVAGPVGGPELERLVAAIGEDLDVELWDDTHHALPEKAPEAQRRRLAPAPKRRPVARESDDLPNDRDALRAIAEARGVDFSRSWGVTRLQNAIRKHED